MTFAEYLYENKIDPFSIALMDNDKLNEYKKQWGKLNAPKTNNDITFDNLSSMHLKIDNNKLVDVIKKMTKTDTDQTNKVGSWIYYCLSGNKEKADKCKEKVSEKYQTTISKHLDSFIKMLKK